MSTWDDFLAKYTQPQMENIIVGFSGIDPNIKSAGSGLTSEQMETIDDLIKEYISKITIKIDSGDIDPDAPPTEVQPVTLKPSEIPHELLDKLLGGDTNGHYHFTKEEWAKVKTLLSSVFPSGSETPVFPTGPTNPSTDDPSGEDDPSGGDDDIPDYSALFATKEPSWGTIGLGAKHRSVKQEGRMYFGTVVKGNKVYNPALVVPIIYDNDSNDKLRLVYTTSSDLTSFAELTAELAVARGITLGDMVHAYFGITNKLQDKYVDKRHFCFYCTYLKSTNKNIYYYGSSTSLHYSTTNYSGYLAGAYKNDAGNTGDQKIVCANGDGGVCIVGYSKDTTSSITTKVIEKGASIGMKVNPGCLRYGAGVFCATGTEGAANSSDGINWNVNKAAPKNMISLHYRSDFTYTDSTGKNCTGAFIACSKETRIFYFSSDGYNWTQCSTKRVPLDSVIATAYDPNKKRYCVVGTPGNVACLTQDFVEWTPTYVSKVNLSVLDVTYAFDKFVIMLKNSDTLYTYTG